MTDESIDLSWNHLIGYAESSQILRRLTDQLPQVILLTGPSGIGKNRFAAKVIASLFCKESCGHCMDCKAIATSQHPDILVVGHGQQLIKTAEAEELQKHLSVQGFQGRRGSLIFDADHMTKESANRLLKTLEEPSEGAWIVMTSSRPLWVLGTIMSRCFKWDLKKPSEDEFDRWMLGVLRDAGKGEKELPTLRLLADGLPGRATQLLRDGVTLEREQHLLQGFQSLYLAKDVSSSLKIAQNLADKSLGLTLDEILRYSERVLNKTYESTCSPNSPNSVVQRRDVLRRIRRFSAAKTALSIPLSLESLALCVGNTNGT
jgi:DNA polymerase-3 subunit delta'